MFNVSSLRMFVLGGRRALLKLCFQVFIVLSSADEAGTSRACEGAWGSSASIVSRVRVSGRRSRSKLTCHSNSLVAVMFKSFGGQCEGNHSYTASMSGAHSLVSIVDLPPSKREKLSSSVYTPKIFRCSLHLAQRKTKCSLDSIASPHSQRFDSTALMLCRHPFSGGCYSRAELRENARLSLGEVVVHASSVTSRPGSVDSA